MSQRYNPAVGQTRLGAAAGGLGAVKRREAQHRGRTGNHGAHLYTCPVCHREITRSGCEAKPGYVLLVAAKRGGWYRDEHGLARPLAGVVFPVASFPARYALHRDTCQAGEG